MTFDKYSGYEVSVDVLCTITGPLSKLPPEPVISQNGGAQPELQ